MSETSGIYRSLIDLTIECDCGFEGDVVGVEDREDLTLWWTCPNCGHPETEHFGDDRD